MAPHLFYTSSWPLDEPDGQTPVESTSVFESVVAGAQKQDLGYFLLGLQSGLSKIFLSNGQSCAGRFQCSPLIAALK